MMSRTFLMMPRRPRQALGIRYIHVNASKSQPRASRPYNSTSQSPTRVGHVQRRALHLAPPFLLDSYTPRYASLTPAAMSAKRSSAQAHLRNCNLCPRLCGVNRYERTGICLIPGSTVSVSTIAPHFGEEPCLQGTHGSGSIFFSGCNLRCVFCQNHSIAHAGANAGSALTPEEVGEWMVKLVDVGRVHNINLVTPEHVVPQVVLALLHAVERGLAERGVPVVYNTSAYDSLESLELLDGLVDVYLPDFKVWEAGTARRLLKVDDYAVHARKSIRAMYEQVGHLCFTGDGLAKSGLLVRHLVMPGLEEEARRIMQWLASEDGVGTDCFVNIMEQYRPDAHVGKQRRGKPKADGDVRYSNINRAVHADEVKSVRRAAEGFGLWRFSDPPKHGGWAL